MHNTIAFVNAIILASCFLSCVYSLPTQSIEAALEIFSTTPAPTPTCFDSYPYPYNGELRSIHEQAVDSEGRLCFESYKNFGMNRLLDKENFDSNYANVTEENCPTWPRFTECLHEHVNSDRCNEVERQQVVDSEYLNVHIVMGDLLCSRSRNQYFQNLWRRALFDGLWDCVFGDDLRESSEQCENKKFGPTGHQKRYQDLSQFFDCLKPGVRSCAKGDLVKEVKLIELFEEFDRALQDTHRAFWNY